MKLRNTLLIILMLSGSLSSWAQGEGLRYYEVETAMEYNDIRPAIEAVQDLDPNGEVWFFDDERTILQFKVNPSVTDAEIRNAIAATGIQLKAGTPDITYQEPVYTTPEGKPMYVVTGDAAADRTRYEQAVEQWNLSNPNEPIAMPLPVGEDQ